MDQARKLGKALGVDGLVIFTFDLREEEFTYTSWGCSKNYCSLMKKMADYLFEKIRKRPLKY